MITVHLWIFPLKVHYIFWSRDRTILISSFFGSLAVSKLAARAGPVEDCLVKKWFMTIKNFMCGQVAFWIWRSGMQPTLRSGCWRPYIIIIHRQELRQKPDVWWAVTTKFHLRFRISYTPLCGKKRRQASKKSPQKPHLEVKSHFLPARYNSSCNADPWRHLCYGQTAENESKLSTRNSGAHYLSPQTLQ